MWAYAPKQSTRMAASRAKGAPGEDRSRRGGEARAVDAAGAFAIVLEGVSSDLAEAVTKAVAAPTIGIGASAQCDGQILVTEDMLGLFEWTPKFVRRYAELGTVIGGAVAAYAADVRSGDFPGEGE